MSDKITFSLNGNDVTAEPGETIWQAAKRVGTDIPHLCWKDSTGYRADGNCRACMVEIEGERVLAASCIRTPKPGMTVTSQSDRARSARSMVLELLSGSATGLVFGPGSGTESIRVDRSTVGIEATIAYWE